jgi:hypothetical protein
MFGPGYRIYFGQDGATLVLLLVGRFERHPGEGHPSSPAILARLPRGEVTWHDAAETGTKDWPRTSGIRSSPAISCWPPRTTACRFRWRWGR